MKGDFLRIFLAISLIVSFVVVASEGRVSSNSSSPKIYVDPRVNSVAPGENFTVDVVIAGITADESLYSWEVDMSFNSTILNVTSVGQGPFLSTLGTTYWVPPVIKNWKGTVEVSEMFFLVLPPVGVTGSGVLANITFQALAEGETSLHFYETQLRTYNGTKILPIEHTTVDGFFAYPLLRDVAVTGVTVSSTSVTAGETVSINVTAENQGEIAETFDVTVLCNSTEIERKTVTDLASGNSETLGFSWNTTDVAAGNYKITAVASELSGETDNVDNTFSNVFVTVTVPSSVFPVELVIVVIAVIIVVATVCSIVLLYLRRRRQTKP